MVLYLPLYFMIGLASHIGVSYVAFFFIGLGLVGRFACGFILLAEVTPRKHQAAAATSLITADVMATLYATFFLKYVSNDAGYIIWIGLGLNVLAVLGSFLLVESPSWLVSQGCQEDAIKALCYIAKFNGAQPLKV